MKFKIIITVIITMAFSIVVPIKARSQVLISLLLGEKLNTGKIEFGLTGGYNRSDLMGFDNSKGLNNFNLGFYFDFTLKKNWYLYTGVLVKSRMGASGIAVYPLGDPELDSAMIGAEVTRKLHYFHVPVFLKYRFKNHFFLDGGIQLGLLNKAVDEFINTIYEKNDLVFTNDILTQYKRLDAGIEAGIGYKLMKGAGMNFGLRYYYGLVNINKEGEDKAYNSSLYFYAEIPIGTQKKK